MMALNLMNDNKDNMNRAPSKKVLVEEEATGCSTYCIDMAAILIELRPSITIKRTISETSEAYSEDEDYYEKKQQEELIRVSQGLEVEDAEKEEEGKENDDFNVERKFNNNNDNLIEKGSQESDHTPCKANLLPRRCVNCYKQYIIRESKSSFCSGECACTFMIRIKERGTHMR